MIKLLTYLKNLIDRIIAILCGGKKSLPQTFVFTSVTEHFTISGANMNFKLKDTATTLLIIAVAATADAAGNAGIFAGPLTYTSDDNGSLIKLIPSVDSLSVSIAQIGPLGTATVSVTDGVTTQQFTVTVEATESVGMTFTLVPPVTPVADQAVALSTEQVASLTTDTVAALVTADVAPLTS